MVNGGQEIAWVVSEEHRVVSRVASYIDLQS